MYSNWSITITKQTKIKMNVLETQCVFQLPAFRHSARANCGRVVLPVRRNCAFRVRLEKLYGSLTLRARNGTRAFRDDSFEYGSITEKYYWVFPVYIPRKKINKTTKIGIEPLFRKVSHTVNTYDTMRLSCSA